MLAALLLQLDVPAPAPPAPSYYPIANGPIIGSGGGGGGMFTLYDEPAVDEIILPYDESEEAPPSYERTQEQTEPNPAYERTVIDEPYGVPPLGYEQIPEVPGVHRTIEPTPAAEPPSLPATLSKFLGDGGVGFASGKKVTELAEKYFGRHGGGVAALGSVVATAAATAKLAKVSRHVRKLEGPLIVGSVIAAVDDLVDIYVNDRGETPLTIHVDAVTFLEKAHANASLQVVRQRGTRKSTGERVMVLTYRSVGTKPPTTWIYREVIACAHDGQFPIGGTLLAAIRKAKER